MPKIVRIFLNASSGFVRRWKKRVKPTESNRNALNQLEGNMNRQYSMWWLFLLLGSGLMVSFAGVAASDEPKKEAKPQISPLLDQVTLAAEERVIKPSSILKTNLGGYAAGGLRIRLNKNKVQAFAPGEEQPRWEATAPEKIHLSWLTANSKVVYLAGYTVNEKNEEAQAESPLRVR